MNPMEWNKIIAAILVGLLLFMGVTLMSESLFEGEEEVLLGAGEEAASETEEVMVAAGPTFNDLLVQAAANPSAGSFNKCKACHTTGQGGANRIGPNLFEVVGSTLGSKEGYSYSSAMASKGGAWSYDALNAFLESPVSALPGTKMTFAGIRTVEERAAIIAYLRAQSSSPLALPEVAAPAEEAGQ